MWTNLKKQIIWGLGVFVLTFFVINLFCFYFISPIKVPKVATVADLTEYNRPALTKAGIDGHLTVAFVGDMMLDRGVKSSVSKNFAGDYAGLFSEVADQLSNYDLLFANLEGPISDRGVDQGGLYSFRFDPKVLPALKAVGFTVFSVANNHTFNWGGEAFTDTLSRLAENGITYVGGGFSGSEAYAGKVITVEGVKVAFLTFSQFRDGGVNSTSTRPGMAMVLEKEIAESVSKARAEADLVVVSYHFGEEYEKLPNDFQQKYAKLAIDAGADLIIGHHPHVVQTLEQYKNVYIIYSLGNFIFDQYFSPETMQGGLLEVEINPGSKRIEKVILKKVNLNKKFQIESII